MKVISHLLTFAIGAGLGIWWGVHNPTQAQQVSDMEQQKAQQLNQLGHAAKDAINQTAAPVAKP